MSSSNYIKNVAADCIYCNSVMHGTVNFVALDREGNNNTNTSPNGSNSTGTATSNLGDRNKNSTIAGLATPVGRIDVSSLSKSTSANNCNNSHRHPITIIPFHPIDPSAYEAAKRKVESGLIKPSTPVITIPKQCK